MPNVLSILRSNRAKPRLLLWITLAIILMRGLLPSAVMFDTRTDDGHFGLVICSGHGPLFSTMSGPTQANGLPSLSVVSKTADVGDMANMNMGMMPVSEPHSFSEPAIAPDEHVALATNRHDMTPMDEKLQDSDAICGFSAVLFSAALTFAVLLLFTLDVICRPVYRQRRTAFVVTVTPYRFALSRAPPLALPL